MSAFNARVQKVVSLRSTFFPLWTILNAVERQFWNPLERQMTIFFSGSWLYIKIHYSALFSCQKKKTKFALGQWNSPYFSQFNGTSLPNGGQRQINDKHLTRLFSSAACVSRWSFAKVVYNKKKFKIYFSTIFFRPFLSCVSAES